MTDKESTDGLTKANFDKQANHPQYSMVGLSKLTSEGLYNVTTGEIIFPGCTGSVTITEAISNGLIDPLLEAYVDPDTNLSVSLKQAMEVGSIDEKTGIVCDETVLQSLHRPVSAKPSGRSETPEGNGGRTENSKQIVLDKDIDHTQVEHHSLPEPLQISSEVNHLSAPKQAEVSKTGKSAIEGLHISNLDVSEEILRSSKDQIPEDTGSVVHTDNLVLSDLQGHTMYKDEVNTDNDVIQMPETHEYSPKRPEKASSNSDQQHTDTKTSTSEIHDLLTDTTSAFESFKYDDVTVSSEILSADTDRQHIHHLPKDSKFSDTIDSAVEDSFLDTLSREVGGSELVNYHENESVEDVAECIKTGTDSELSLIHASETIVGMGDVVLDTVKPIEYKASISIEYPTREEKLEDEGEDDGLSVTMKQLPNKIVDKQIEEKCEALIKLQQSYDLVEMNGQLKKERAFESQKITRSYSEVSHSSDKIISDQEETVLEDVEKIHVLHKGDPLHSPSDRNILFSEGEDEYCYTLHEALRKGLINPSTGEVKNPNTGVVLSLGQAVDSGLIDGSASKIMDTLTEECVSLNQALQEDLVDGEIGKVLDKNVMEYLTLDEALNRGLILKLRGIKCKEAVSQGFLVGPYMKDPSTGQNVRVEDAINTLLLDTDDLMVRDPQTQDLWTLEEALNLGILNKDLGMSDDDGNVMHLCTLLEKGVILQSENIADPTVTDYMTTGHAVEEEMVAIAGIPDEEVLEVDQTEWTHGTVDGPIALDCNIVGGSETDIDVSSSSELASLRLHEDTKSSSFKVVSQVPPEIPMSLVCAVEHGFIHPQTSMIQCPLDECPLPLKDAVQQGVIRGSSPEIYDSKTQEKLSVNEAMERGILDARKAVMCDTKTGTWMPIKEGVKKGLVVHASHSFDHHSTVSAKYLSNTDIGEQGVSSSQQSSYPISSETYKASVDISETRLDAPPDEPETQNQQQNIPTASSTDKDFSSTPQLTPTALSSSSNSMADTKTPTGDRLPMQRVCDNRQIQQLQLHETIPKVTAYLYKLFVAFQCCLNHLAANFVELVDLLFIFNLV